MMEEALGHIDRQLELVATAPASSRSSSASWGETRKRVRRKLRELDAD